jgi:hypothetical protein
VHSIQPHCRRRSRLGRRLGRRDYRPCQTLTRSRSRSRSPVYIHHHNNNITRYTRPYIDTTHILQSRRLKGNTEAHGRG